MTEIEIVVAEMVAFWGVRDARIVAIKNATGRRFNEHGRRFWFQVWRNLPDEETTA